ncbi:enhanced serine sensitivity protein [Citrobacter freundii]|nr:enhanced serine sensitivity protein [Citrobacter freundii]
MPRGVLQRIRYRGDEPIDICQVRKGEKGVSHFITEHIAPFYERRWGGFLRDFKQNRII